MDPKGALAERTVVYSAYRLMCASRAKFDHGGATPAGARAAVLSDASHAEVLNLDLHGPIALANDHT